jgi:hypothetical protein
MFDVMQRGLADSLDLEGNIQYLKQIAENQEKALRLAEKQSEEVVKDAKRQRRSFYISTANSCVGEKIDFGFCWVLVLIS